MIRWIRAIRTLPAGLLCLCFAACGTKADLVVSGGVLWTGLAHGMPRPGAVAIARGKIVAVGDSATVAPYLGPRTSVVRARGGLVLPGFVDGHTHFVDGGFQLASVDLRDAATPTEFIRRIGAYARTLKPGEWILGGDWDHPRWPGQRLPQHQWIDSVTPDNPVFVSRLDGHEALANASALRAAGVTRDTPTRRDTTDCSSTPRPTCAAGSAARTPPDSRSRCTPSGIAPTRSSCRSTTAWLGRTVGATAASGSSTPSTYVPRTFPGS